MLLLTLLKALLLLLYQPLLLVLVRAVMRH
jgi:hypothetical protein